LGLDGVAGTTRTPAALVRFVLRKRIAALNHEAFDDTVKAGTVIESLLRQLFEILDMARRDLGPEFEHDFAFGRGDEGNFAHGITGMFKDSGKNGGRLDIVEVGKVLFQVGVSLLLNPALIGPATAGSAFAVLAVDLVHNIHSLDHLAKGREAHPIKAVVVAVIDEQLRGPRVGPGGRKRDRPARVAGLDWVVGNPSLAPGGGDLRIAVDAKLDHEPGDHAEKSNVLEVAGANQVVEAVRTVGRQRAGDFHREVSLGRFKFHFERVRGFLGEFGGIGEI